MIAILKSLIYLATLPTVLLIPICDKDLSYLNYKKQIDISIACSVNENGGNYSEEYFKGLYEEK
jgi:hypothetical protein|tara:strand:- start:27 stop:218 length:192 start_codon:yes stop_codon:yes gene_type:complete